MKYPATRIRYTRRSFIVQLERTCRKNHPAIWYFPNRGRSQKAIRYDNGEIAWDFPGAIPQEAKRLTARLYSQIATE